MGEQLKEDFSNADENLIEYDLHEPKGVPDRILGSTSHSSSHSSESESYSSSSKKAARARVRVHTAVTVVVVSPIIVATAVVVSLIIVTTVVVSPVIVVNLVNRKEKEKVEVSLLKNQVAANQEKEKAVVIKSCGAQ